MNEAPDGRIRFGMSPVGQMITVRTGEHAGTSYWDLDAGAPPEDIARALTSVHAGADAALQWFARYTDVRHVHAEVARWLSTIPDPMWDAWLWLAALSVLAHEDDIAADSLRRMHERLSREAELTRTHPSTVRRLEHIERRFHPWTASTASRATP